MDQKDVEMEDAGQLLEDEVVAGQECAEKDEIAINEAGDKQQESCGLVNADVIAQSPNEIGVEQEVQEEEEVQEEREEQEVQDEQEEQEVQEEQEEQEMQEEREVQEEQEVRKVQEEQRNQDTEEVHPDKTEQELPVDETRDIEKDDTTMTDEDKIIDSKNDTTVMTGDDMIDDSKNDATEMAADDKIHDMDDNHGVIEETEHGGSIKIPENNDENYTGDEKHQPPPTPNALMTYSHAKAEDHIVIAETPKNELDDTTVI